jgi:hypothetical protein
VRRGWLKQPDLLAGRERHLGIVVQWLYMRGGLIDVLAERRDFVMVEPGGLADRILTVDV